MVHRFSHRPGSLALLASLLLLLLTAGPAVAAGPINQSIFGVAVEGTDVVAYFTDAKVVPGVKQNRYTWHGASWRFASAAHRALFAANPTKYAPQFGGYCAYGVAQGAKVGIDPQAWTIYKGKLYLNVNPEVQARWRQDIPGNLAKAAAKWPGLQK